MVVGPLLEDAVVDAWLSDEQQLEAMFTQDFEEIGFATTIYTSKYNETVGIVVQILGTEFDKAVTPLSMDVAKTQVANPTPIPFPNVSSEEVFKALNDYRLSHDVPTLNENNYLCQYAQKRLIDQINFGSLDGHQGFKDDFADPESLPSPIIKYGGGKIAENLAYQNCRNMTTGDAFVAETGTALIEWCFDSSTAGHRDAQLSREFENACVRGSDGYFVVIFGSK